VRAAWHGAAAQTRVQRVATAHLEGFARIFVILPPLPHASAPTFCRAQLVKLAGVLGMTLAETKKLRLEELDEVSALRVGLGALLQPMQALFSLLFSPPDSRITAPLWSQTRSGAEPGRRVSRGRRPERR